MVEEQEGENALMIEGVGPVLICNSLKPDQPRSTGFIEVAADHLNSEQQGSHSWFVQAGYQHVLFFNHGATGARIQVCLRNEVAA